MDIEDRHKIDSRTAREGKGNRLQVLAAKLKSLGRHFAESRLAEGAVGVD
jgi:hypothetical protein